jgi:uncharacterized protein (TIGR02186 family)
MSLPRHRAFFFGRGISLAFVFLAALVVCPARAVDLEADLSTHYIEIRTTFRGAQVTVFGAILGEAAESLTSHPPPLDVIVVVRGPPEMIAIRRKEEVGPIWINRASVTAANVPSFYYVASTRPIDTIVDPGSLDRYHIGLDHLGINFSASGAKPVSGAAVTVPGVDTSQAFRSALIRLMVARHAFSNTSQITFIRPHLFRAEVGIPSTVPDGNYGAEVYVVRNKEVIDAEYTVFVIDKKGLEADVYGLAQRQPALYGFLGVFIAVAAGWISELAFRRR